MVPLLMWCQPPLWIVYMAGGTRKLSISSRHRRKKSLHTEFKALAVAWQTVPTAIALTLCAAFPLGDWARCATATVPRPLCHGYPLRRRPADKTPTCGVATRYLGHFSVRGHTCAMVPLAPHTDASPRNGREAWCAARFLRLCRHVLNFLLLLICCIDDVTS